MDDRLRQILATLAQMDKQFGKGSVLMLGSRASLPVEVITTGSIGIDNALGAGGFPRGRVIEVFGPESSGKTTLALHAIAEAQKAGGAAAFIDAEHALDPIYAANLGVDTENLIVSQPDYGEQALEIAQALVISQAFDVIVIDSVAALTPKAEVEGEMGDSHMGLHARLMSQALRKLTGSISRSRCMVIFINQIRMKIGVMFGNPETTTGGNALKFYASVRMDIRRIGSIKKGDEVTGSETRVKVVKNKVAPPFRQAEFDVMYGEGISREGEVLELGVLHGVLEKSGAWYVYNGDRLGQGKDNSREFLKENPALAKEIEAKIREKAGATAVKPEAAEEPAEDDGKVEKLPTRKRGWRKARYARGAEGAGAQVSGSPRAFPRGARPQAGAARGIARSAASIAGPSRFKEATFGRALRGRTRSLPFPQIRSGQDPAGSQASRHRR